MLKNYSIRVKMIIVLVTISLQSMGAVTLVNSYVDQNILLGQANDSLLGAATQTETILDLFIDNQIQLTRVAAKNPVLVNYLTLSPDEHLKNRASASNHLNAFCSNRQEILILSCALLDKQGRNLIDTYALDGVDESKNDYFQQPLQTGLPYMSPMKYVDNKQVVYFSSPIRDLKGEIIGVLRIRYNALRIEDIIRNNNDLGGKDSYAVLVDEHYIILAHGLSPQFASWPLEPLTAKLVTQLQKTQRLPTTFAPEPNQYSRQFAAALRETNFLNPFFTQPLITTRGELELVSGAAVGMKNQPWRVVFVQPNDVFVASIRTQIQATLFVTALVALMVVGLAVWLAYSIAHPIIALTETIQRIDQGNFEANIVVSSNDEIGRLGITFNNMISRLRERTQAVYKLLEEREETIIRLQELDRVKSENLQLLVEQEERKLKNAEMLTAMGNVASNMIHRINNSVGSIRADIVELQESLSDNQIIGQDKVVYLEILDDMFTNAEKTLVLAKKMRDPFQPIMTELVDITKCIKMVLAEKNILDRPDLVIIRTLPTNLPKVQATQQIQLVFDNLISNALRVMENKGKIIISSDYKMGNDWVNVYVQDSGPGISSAIKNVTDIFELGVTDSKNGMGFGLWWCKFYLNLLGGDIELVETTSEGCIFLVKLPVKKNSLESIEVN